MSDYNTITPNVIVEQNTNQGNVVTDLMFKERRAQLQRDRRQKWLADVVKKHTEQ